MVKPPYYYEMLRKNPILEFLKVVVSLFITLPKKRRRYENRNKGF
jgi:hypothetical protein